MPRQNKIQLHGFNNLTKTLSFNIYDVSYAASPEQDREYIRYVNAAYSTPRLTGILYRVSEIIGAQVLNVARQDYEPHGASVTMLIAEEPIAADQIANTEHRGPLPRSLVGHLDKSHLTVHTYPENHPAGGVSTFRVDIDISTCGLVSPLQALGFLIHSFESDIVMLDYRVRGFTRDVQGRKHFIDHEMSSIQNYLARDIRERYRMIDVNVRRENIFHTKMMLKAFELEGCLFGVQAGELSLEERQEISDKVRREMLEIFRGRDVGSDLKRS